MSRKKMVIVGELNCDLFYKNEFFKQLGDLVSERLHQAIKKGAQFGATDVQNLVRGAITDMPKKIPSEAHIKRGGNGNNSTELFGKLGVPIKLVTVTGTGSEWMKAELEAMGVDTSCVFQVQKTQPISTIIEDPTTTKIFTAANFKREMNFSSVSLGKDELSDATIAFLTPMGPKFEPVLSMLQSTDSGITTAITVEIQAIDGLETLQRVVRQSVDILFVNKADALTVSEKENIEDADKVLSRFARIRFITMGAEGALVKSEFTGPITIPVFKVKVTDRTGAGDAFAAGVLLKCHEMAQQGGSIVSILGRADDTARRVILKEIGEFGSAVAALKVSLARTPTRAEVQGFLVENRA